MYLLNDRQIHSHVENSDRVPYLDIKNFELGCLQHTSYYFRLGSYYELHKESGETIRRLTAETPSFELLPGEFAIVKTHEIFVLTGKVMGVFGQVSEIARSGLQLIHSPFIDPFFNGALEIGLSNVGPKKATLIMNQRIGKVSFFDISDTYPVEMRKGSLQEATFVRRRPRRDDDPVHFQGD